MAGSVSSGSVTGTSKLQLPDAGTEPALKIRFEVPLICEPVPHISVNGSPVASMPEIAASRSSLKASPVAAKALLALPMVKRIVVVFESVRVSGVKTLVNVGARPATVSCALAAATGAKPVTLSGLVVLV